MNKPRFFLFVAALWAVTLILPACGITAPQHNEGYADLESMGLLDTDNVMTISIGPTLLRFAAAHIDDDPETKALLKDLDGVRIRIYEIERNSHKVAARINGMQKKLQSNGWEPVMLVRDEGEETHMLVKFSEDRILGLTLLTMDEDSEVVVINLMGEIRPQSFSNVMVALDVDNDNARKVQVANVN